MVFVGEVLTPLSARFPSHGGGKRFRDGRLRSFRHDFCSSCANSGYSELVVMTWLGHTKPDMTRRYYHLRDNESLRLIGKLTLRPVTAAASASDPSPREEQSPTPPARQDATLTG